MRRNVYFAYLYRVCVRVAFTLVILNIKEDISILVGKHTNSCTAVHVVSSAPCGAYTHPRAAAYLCRRVPDLVERPEKNAVAAPTDKRDMSLEAFARNECDFPNGRKVRCHSVHPTGVSVDREVSSGLNHSVGKHNVGKFTFSHSFAFVRCPLRFNASDNTYIFTFFISHNFVCQIQLIEN